jgi:cobyric acid synthase
VRPFKPQNMSNNAAVTADGGEIGRAQALQAMACRTPPTVHMNPVLLKPQSDVGAQVVVRGKVVGAYKARAFQGSSPTCWPPRSRAIRRLAAEADLVLVEGAGSPAETNLRANDIANMGFAHAADVPVALVGDIDRGHVIAALAGAHLVLDAADRDRIKGFIINKFRGDPSLFDDGRREIVPAPAGRTWAWRPGWPGPRPARRGRRGAGASGPGRRRQACGSSCRCCRGSPISTSSTRCGPIRTSTSPSCRPERPCPATPTW